jgi:hypothetical protein
MGAWASTLACSGTPSPDAVERDADRVTALESEPAADFGDASTRADDPLLARGRRQLRGGRVPDAVRQQLLASRDPDHRHAARLLQAVAGETPAAVLSRAAGRQQEVVVLGETERPSVEPVELAPSEPDPALVQGDPSDDERLDPLPKLDDIPRDSPLWAWLAGATEIEPEPPPPPIELPLERLVGPELMLLRERPPRTSTRDGLVILTSLSLWPGEDAGEVWLELVGAGPASVSVQPLDQSRVRLTVADAGAVPSFLTARPEAPGITILDVIRRERDVELELALAPGWRMVGLAQLGNGATVGFSRSDTLGPS